MICAILGLLANTLAAVKKYSLLNKDKLTYKVQKQLPKKPKNFFAILFYILEFILNFEHFEVKDDPHSLCVFRKLQSSKEVLQ